MPKAKLLTPEAPDGEFLDPVQWTETVKFLHTHTTLPDMPLGLQLRQHPVFGIGGDRDKARDAARHPMETLRFFGLQPAMTVVEFWPGSGWYTEILAPYLAKGAGTYVAALFPEGPTADPAQAREMGIAGRRRCIEHFSWSTIAERTARERRAAARG